MPGRKLNDAERALLRFWTEPPRAFVAPLLKGLTIEGPPRLRGIERVSVPFNYPLTALCGRNGAGKSTLLALTALSSNRPRDWEVDVWPTSPTRKQPRGPSYWWTDFFFRQTGQPLLDGLKVTFDFTIAGNDIRIARERRGGRWRTLPDEGRSRPPSFPSRHIEFVSLARILPPSELYYMTKHFKTMPTTDGTDLSHEACSAMGTIFGRSYDRINVQSVNGVSLATCHRGTSVYNGFHMGAGENAVVTILSKLQRLPVGGLLIIEEMEHGLHTEAQVQLVRVLTNLVSTKRQQIIFTTHAADIIDELPRQGRIIIQQLGAEHKVVTNPTTRFSTYAMSGVAQPECLIFVEDNFAATLINRCVPKDVRIRVKVLPIGDKSKVATQLGAHVRGQAAGPAICIFDGDCTDREIRTWMRREELPEDGSNYTCLPGVGDVPEAWVIRAIAEEPFLSKFADRLEISIAEAETELLRLMALPDPHDIPYELSNKMGLSVSEATHELVTTVASTHPELDDVRQSIQAMILD